MPSIGPRPKPRRCRACGELIAAQHTPWIVVSTIGVDMLYHSYCNVKQARRD